MYLTLATHLFRNFSSPESSYKKFVCMRLVCTSCVLQYNRQNKYCGIPLLLFFTTNVLTFCRTRLPKLMPCNAPFLQRSCLQFSSSQRSEFAKLLSELRCKRMWNRKHIWKHVNEHSEDCKMLAYIHGWGDYRSREGTSSTRRRNRVIDKDCVIHKNGGNGQKKLDSR